MLLLAPTAHADNELETCTTHTARLPSEIVVPMSEPPQGPTGVTIALGETLCLAGRTDRDGVFQTWLADRHRHEPVLVLLRLESAPQGTRLVTRTSLPGGLMYIVATGSRPARLATIAPDETQRQWLDVGQQPLLLFRFRSEWVPETIRPPLPPFAPRIGEVGFSLSGEARRLSAGGIQDTLRAAGYGSSPRTFVGGGGDLTITLARWRLEFSLLVGGATTATSMAPSVGDFVASLGYEFLRWRGLTGFALGGIGSTSYRIDRLPTAPGYHAGDWIVAADTVLQLGAGFEEAVPFLASRSRWTDGLAFTFGLRAGYLRQLVESRWSDNRGNDIPGLPKVDLSGTWVALDVGMNMYGR
jgi:hypothetical protein